MPLGLSALVAVGVHAAADTVDDRFLALVQGFDAWLDHWFAQYESLQPWVDKFGSREQTWVARSLTLAWELLADLVLLFPLLGYREESNAFKKDTWKTLLQRFRAQPTPMRILRPAVTGIFALAGAYAIARMVDGALFLSLRAGVMPDALAQPAARAIAFVAFLHVTIAFGWRAVLRALQHADQVSTPVANALTAAERLALLSGQTKPKKAKSPWTLGLVGSAVTAPLALAALFDALPLLSFFR